MPRKSAQSTQRQPAVFGYVRVSTTDQAANGVSLDEQQRRIEGRCLEQGWQLSEIFVERGVSGSVPLAERSAGGALIKAAQAGDVIVVAKLDRLFRSVADAANTIDEWVKADIKLVSIGEGLDLMSPYGRMMAHLIAAFAELERNMIGERTRAALQAKKARGERVGSDDHRSACRRGWVATDRSVPPC